MLEKPEIQDTRIATVLQNAYGLQARQVIFLPLGADVNTAVYRVEAGDGTAYFLKLRKGDFYEISISVPKFLKGLGIRAIVAPLSTQDGNVWAELDEFRTILYPFIEGKNGYETGLSDRQWVDFGAAMKAVHSAKVPPDLRKLIPVETYTPKWREMVVRFQRVVEEEYFADPAAAKLAAVLKSSREDITRVVERANQLCRDLQTRSPEMVLCHADIHAGNLLVDEDGALTIVDWDNPLFAPKERDLAMVGGSAIWKDPRQVALFYRGYDLPKVDRQALAYYRYERLIQDIAAFCEQLFFSDEGNEDREQAYHYCASEFLPGHELDLAVTTDDLLGKAGQL